MKYFLRALLGSVLVFCAQISNAEANQSVICGKASIDLAENCKDITVKFDLSACGDSQSERKAKVSCHQDRATAMLKFDRFVYQVSLVKVVGSTGNVVWDTEGPVTKTSLSSPAKPSLENDAVLSPSKDKMPETTLPIEATPTPVPSAAAAPVAAPASPLSGVGLSGQFDGYYSGNFNHPPAVNPTGKAPIQGLPVGNNGLRAYDLYANQAALNFAELTIKKTGAEVSFTMDLDFGQEADYNAALSTASGFSVDDVSRHLGQVYLTYVPASVPNLTVDFGKMDSHMGLETPKARDDWQYSRSSIYTYGGPIWHVGLHVGYAVIPNKLIANAYVYDGWNTLYSNNSGKTYGSQLKYMPTDALTVIYNMITGPEEANDTANWRTVHEVNATWNLTRNFAIATDLLTGQEPNAPLLSGQNGNAEWRGVSLGTKSQVTSRYSISPRLEYFRDFSGFLLGSLPQSLLSATLTQSYTLTDGLEGRFEMRVDHSTVGAFTTGSGASVPNQPTILFSVLYGF